MHRNFPDAGLYFSFWTISISYDLAVASIVLDVSMSSQEGIDLSLQNLNQQLPSTPPQHLGARIFSPNLWLL